MQDYNKVTELSRTTILLTANSTIDIATELLNSNREIREKSIAS